MRDKKLGVIALLIGAYLLAQAQGFKLPSINLLDLGGTTPVVEPLPEPSAAMKDAVQPLVGVVPSFQDRRHLTVLYKTMATAIEKDTSSINTTSQVRKFNSLAGESFMEMTDKSFEEATTGLGKLLEIAGQQGSMIGLKNETLNKESRARVVAAFRAIAWSFEQ